MKTLDQYPLDTIKAGQNVWINFTKKDRRAGYISSTYKKKIDDTDPTTYGNPDRVGQQGVAVTFTVYAGSLAIYWTENFPLSILSKRK